MTNEFDIYFDRLPRAHGQRAKLRVLAQLDAELRREKSPLPAGLALRAATVAARGRSGARVRFAVLNVIDTMFTRDSAIATPELVAALDRAAEVERGCADKGAVNNVKDLARLYRKIADRADPKRHRTDSGAFESRRPREKYGPLYREPKA